MEGEDRVTLDGFSQEGISKRVHYFRKSSTPHIHQSCFSHQGTLLPGC